MNYSVPTIRIFQKVYEKLKPFHSLIQNQPAIIAYSGGKDSTLLSHFYKYFHSVSKCPEPVLFHMNHLIRNNFTQEEEIILEMNTFSEKTSVKKKNIPKISKRIKKSLEETGRIYRYKYLNKLAIENNGYITTGHHPDDYFETVLINLIRGGGYSSLETLPIYKNKIFRPLMLFTEEDRNNLFIFENWKYFEDESNESSDYLRNRIRKNIIPILKKEGLNPAKVYSNFHETHDFDLLEGSLSKQGRTPSYLKIDQAVLEFLNMNSIKRLLDFHAEILKLHPLTKKILLELKKELDQNTNFLIENQEIILWKNPSSDLFLIPKSSPALQKPKSVYKEENNFLLWNNLQRKVPVNFEIGNWTEGLKILKNGNHKEVSEVLREKQIPTPIRQTLPILFSKNQCANILFSLWDKKLKDFVGEIH